MPRVVNIRSGEEFILPARKAVESIKRKIISAIAEEAIKRIKEKSHGQFEPETISREDGFVIRVSSSKDQKREAIETIERETNAFADTAHSLDREYVVNLINRSGRET